MPGIETAAPQPDTDRAQATETADATHSGKLRSAVDFLNRLLDLDDFSREESFRD